jgi:hypothetical protein
MKQSKGRNMLTKISFSILFFLCSGVFAQNTPDVSIHLIHMGGNDCPPCRAWRALELPKLQSSKTFASIKFSYVTKTIGSPVPPAFFLPDEVKPLKAILDVAGGGSPGSPQVALVVNGKVFDYWWGTRSAEEIEKMILSVQGKGEYPLTRCLRFSHKGRGDCAERPIGGY